MLRTCEQDGQCVKGGGRGTPLLLLQQVARHASPELVLWHHLPRQPMV